MAARGKSGERAAEPRADAAQAVPPSADLAAITQAFERFTQTTARMEESYRLLEARVQSLDRELQDKNRELTLATEYLNAVLDSMSDGVIAVDPAGSITTFNRAAAQILGRAPGAVMGRTYSEEFGPGPAPQAAPQFRELTTTDGVKVPVSERAAPISGVSGERRGTVYVFQDLRELEALREEVRRKDRLAALGQMAATIAHEIRNPLGGIQGFAALLQRDVPEDDARRRLVEKIISGTKSLDRVVNELLEYTRPLELKIEPVDVSVLVAGAIEFLPAVPAGVRVINRAGADVSVRADASKLKQVLLNILLNAVQGVGDAGEIVVSVEANVDHVAIVVRDSGEGIAAEHLDKIFMPFFTTREKGTGLGLAAASKIVESHGGTIEAVSTPGQGATFHVRLPRRGEDY
jgi:PAS domain S-box-containing protein